MGFYQMERGNFISKALPERQPSLTKLFEEARGVGLEDFALNLTRQGMSEKVVYDEMKRHIEETGQYFGRR